MRRAADSLSRRERQILDVLHRVGPATVATVRRELPDAPGYSAVRALLRILEAKGQVRHDVDGPRYSYVPTTSRKVASRSALRHLVRTFFGGSTEAAVLALLDSADSRLTDEQIEVLRRRVAAARSGEQ